MELNLNQQRAVRHREGPMAVVAGPGSGKTRVIVNRIAGLISAGADPARIMVVTFTRKAAGELRQRVAQAIGDDAKQLRCGTFHSLALGLLKEFWLGPVPEICPDRRLYDLLSRLLCAADLDATPSDVMIDLALLKANLITPRQAMQMARVPLEARLAAVYDRYEAVLAEQNQMDFDNIIWKVIRMAGSEPYRQKLQELTDFILVDEYQDTNPMQSHFIDLFTGLHSNVFVVGDADQCLYGFRGSNVGEILHFNHKFPAAKMVDLSLNYRSTSTVVNAACSMIGYNRQRIGKELQSASGYRGEPICFQSHRNEYREAEWVAEQVKVVSGSTAVLARTNKHLEPIAQALDSRGIGYEIVRDRSRELAEETADSPTPVKLMTCHASKGLEFDNVFITGAEEGNYPHYLSDCGTAIEEERRIFYVALTRARKRVFLSAAEVRRGRPTRLSRFVREIDFQYLRQEELQKRHVF